MANNGIDSLELLSTSIASVSCFRSDDPNSMLLQSRAKLSVGERRGSETCESWNWLKHKTTVECVVLKLPSSVF